MDPNELTIYELLGPTCFNILEKYFEKNKIDKYPFEELCPFIKSADDLTALFVFLTKRGNYFRCNTCFDLLVKRVTEEKSPIVYYEFLEQQHIAPPQDMPESIRAFLLLRDDKNLASANAFLKDFLNDKSTCPHALQIEILKCFFYTTSPKIREVIFKAIKECETNLHSANKDRENFFLHSYENLSNTNLAGNELLIRTTLPLITNRALAGQLDSILQIQKNEPSTIQFITDFCLAFLNNAPIEKYQELFAQSPSL